MGRSAKNAGISLQIEAPPYIGSQNAARGIAIVITNAGSKTQTVQVTLTGEGLAPFSARVGAPFFTSVKLSVPQSFPAENDSVCTVLLTATAHRGTKELARAEKRITLLPRKQGAVHGHSKIGLWERRLLDLSGKNALVHFTGKHALRIFSEDDDALFSDLAAEEHTLFESDGREKEAAELRNERESGLLRACGEEFEKTCAHLLKKSREAEETGATLLYFAFGALRYFDGTSEKCAPLVLAPAAMTQKRGMYSVRCTAGEFFPNTTLMELLKRQFGVRLPPLSRCGSIRSLIGAFREAVKKREGFKISDEVHLAVFSFQRFALWNDLRKHGEEFLQNAAVSALSGGTWEQKPAKCGEEDGAKVGDVLLPLPADGSQYAAIALSKTGASFVLHGPPGTGKSQTIANMIANALFDGKRVLFVAEKRAALDVVQRRLEAVGVGDFCLPLHDPKRDKGEIAARMLRTLRLPKEREGEEFFAKAKEIEALREQLAAPVHALHLRRRAGFSVYEAILGYFENKDAPDLFCAGSAFFGTLTQEMLSECKSAIVPAAAAARAKVFHGAELTEYSQRLRDLLIFSAETLLAQIRNLRAFAGLLAQFFRQKAWDGKHLCALVRLVKELGEGRASQYFSGVDEGEFSLFFGANRRLDAALCAYFKHFRAIVRLESGLEDALKGGGKLAAARAKRELEAVALHPLEEEDIPKYLQTLLAVHEEMRAVAEHTDLSARFRTRGGMDFKKREAFLSALYALHALGAEAFPSFDADAFNSACIQAENGCATSLFEGFRNSAEGYFAARKQFFAALRCAEPEDDLDALALRVGSLLDNIDQLPSWCMYRATVRRMGGIGLHFNEEAIEGGVSTETLLAGFEKCVCKGFLEREILSDPAFSYLTAGTFEETAEQFRRGYEAFTLLSRARVRAALLSRLPEEGACAGEVAALVRFSERAKGGIRTLFAQIPTLLPALCPCLLMTPTAAAQYLLPEANAFDLVIFDEASQMTSAEAVGALARAKAAIVVGDPNQLPPTSFFRTGKEEEENAESVLDDCLAIGMCERRLLWHYRSRHESLISFSNAMFYENRLCTVPSPDALKSRVELLLTQGKYERGGAKCNRGEGEALVREIVRRLSDPDLSKQSMGVVTFSGAQQAFIERILAKELAKNGLEEAAYAREEPLFVKNLENVQGDERDVILFSVCYGPDAHGRVSLNFGPLNRTGGWRRLNVATSRARERMLVFSSMTASHIDLNKTSSRGAAGLKAFLAFAESGSLPHTAAQSGREGIGKYIAKELERYGYECRTEVGSSAFKVDVAVLEPCGGRFLLGILCDGEENFSVKERNLLQVQALERGNWKVMRVGSVAFYNDPKREIGRIKRVLDYLTGRSRAGEWLKAYSKTYRAVKTDGAETAAFVNGGEHDAEIEARLRKIVAAEEPISRNFLVKRCLQTFGIRSAGSRAENIISEIIDGCRFRRDRADGVEYFYRTSRAIGFDRVRIEEGECVRRKGDDFSVYETVSLIRGALRERVALYFDELVPLVSEIFKVQQDARFADYVQRCIDYGEKRGIFVRSRSDRISLA